MPADSTSSPEKDQGVRTTALREGATDVRLRINSIGVGLGCANAVPRRRAIYLENEKDLLLIDAFWPDVLARSGSRRKPGHHR